jgi:hypothetical protein
MSATERVKRFRSSRHRLDLGLDLVDHDQVERFAQEWKCSRQEVLLIAFRACLPAMKRASSAQEVFNLVRDALEATGIE